MSAAQNSSDEHFWRWQDRMGIQRPGGPPVKDARYRIGKDGQLTVLPYLAKQTEGPLRRAGYKDGGKPVVVPRGTPLPPSQRPLYSAPRVPVGDPVLIALYARLAVARRKLAAAERQRDQDWADFVAGRATAGINLKSVQQWRRCNVRLAKIQFVEIPLAEAAARDPGVVIPALIPRPSDRWGYRIGWKDDA